MICGKIENVYTFPLLPEHSTKDYTEQIENLLQDAPKGSIIIADLFGGTTSNIAAIISSKYDVIALSGLDIAMLIAVDELRGGKYLGEELTDKILRKSINNCKDLNKMLNKEKKEEHIRVNKGVNIIGRNNNKSIKCNELSLSFL